MKYKLPIEDTNRGLKINTLPGNYASTNVVASGQDAVPKKNVYISFLKKKYLQREIIISSEEILFFQIYQKPNYKDKYFN